MRLMIGGHDDVDRGRKPNGRPFILEISMLSPTKLAAAFDRVTDCWSPKVIGQVNDQLLKAAKLKGQLVWHAHSRDH